MDVHCFLPKTINSGVPQDSVLSPTLFLLFIIDLLNLTYCPIYSYADDTTFHFSTSYNRCPTQQELRDSRRDAIRRLNFDISLVSGLGQSKPAFRFINSSNLTVCLDFLSHRRNVASLSLLYRHFYADFSFELYNCMPLPPPVPNPHLRFCCPSF